MIRPVVHSLVRRRSMSAGIVSCLALALAACGGETAAPPSGPQLPENPTPTTQFRQSAFIVDVNTAKKTVTVTNPTNNTSRSIGTVNGKRTGSIDHSILGADVAQVVVSNFAAGEVGVGAPAGKILVTMDLSIRNIRSGVQLITPTFPVPPDPSLPRIYAWPFENVVTTTTGSASGSGNEIIVEMPNRGVVLTSDDWNGDGATLTGAPYNFFNDVGCAAGSNDCFRYEAYPAPLGPLSATGSQRIGFIIDATVSNFRSRILLAADLADAGPPVSTTISGLVSSPTLGNLAGVVVSIDGTPVNGPGGTPAAGTYSAAVTGTGFKSVTLTLPAALISAGCTNPGAQSVTVGASPPAGGYTANFSVTCPAAAGTVTGTVNVVRAAGASQSLSGSAVTVSPTGGSAVNGALVGAANATTYTYSVAGVGLGASGAGDVTLPSLPSGCTASGPASYSGLSNLGSVAAPAITVNCAAPPAFYQLRATWGTPTATTIAVTFSIDMTTRNDASDPAPDALAALSYTFDYSASAARVGIPANVNAACVRQDGGTVFDVFTRNVNASRQILFSMASTVGATGVQPLMTCTLPLAAGAAGLATGSFTPASIVATIFGTPTNIGVNSFVDAAQLPGAGQTLP